MDDHGPPHFPTFFYFIFEMWSCHYPSIYSNSCLTLVIIYVIMDTAFRQSNFWPSSESIHCSHLEYYRGCYWHNVSVSSPLAIFRHPSIVLIVSIIEFVIDRTFWPSTLWPSSGSSSVVLILIIIAIIMDTMFRPSTLDSFRNPGFGWYGISVNYCFIFSP